MTSKRPAMESLKDSPKIKRNKYEQSYLVKYSKIPGIKPSKLGPKYARCDYCKCDVSISHAGVYDISHAGVYDISHAGVYAISHAGVYNISHAGVYDINSHREKIKHKENETVAVNNHTSTDRSGK